MKRFISLFTAYLALFFLLTYPSSTDCFSAFLGDEGDGLQNLWNIWWVKYSLFHLHTNPLRTRFIFFPEGTSLLGHTISLANTVPAAALALLFGLAPSYNLWLILGFVLGGVFTSYLFWEFGRGVLGAFVAGFLYTFSEYHFAHAVGHFQLIPVEWLPLFLWAWLRLLARPALVRAAMASAAFLIVFFTDYYYALYSVIAGAIALFFRPAIFRDRNLWSALALFAALVIAGTGPMLVAAVPFLQQPLTGSHNPFEFGADLLSPFVPGKYWRFHRLTEPVWAAFKTPAIEGCTYLGWAALILAGIGLTARRKSMGWKEWFLIASGVFFLAMSFGPIPHVHGVTIRGIWGAYHHLETLLPIVKWGGIPDRMIVMTILCVAVLAGLGVEALQRQSRKGVLTILMILGFVECLPAALPNTPMPAPRFYAEMKKLPEGAVFDSIASSPQGAWRRYFQTQYEMPTSSGLSSRVPLHLSRQPEWSCQDFRYVLLADSDPVPPFLASRAPILAADGMRLFDCRLCDLCASAPLR
jgi:hypothetical protein